MELPTEIIEKIFDIQIMQEYWTLQDSYCGGYLINKYFTENFLKLIYDLYDSNETPNQYSTLMLDTTMYDYRGWTSVLKFEIENTEQLELLYGFEFQKFKNCHTILIFIESEDVFNIDKMTHFKRDNLLNLKEMTFYVPNSVDATHDMQVLKDWDIKLILWISDIPYGSNTVMRNVKEVRKWKEEQTQEDVDELSRIFPCIEVLNLILGTTWEPLDLKCFNYLKNICAQLITSNITFPATLETLEVQLGKNTVPIDLLLPQQLNSFSCLSYRPLNNRLHKDIIGYMRKTCTRYSFTWGINDEIVIQINFGFGNKVVDTLINEVDSDAFEGKLIDTEYVWIHEAFIGKLPIKFKQMSFLGTHICHYLESRLKK